MGCIRAERHHPHPVRQPDRHTVRQPRRLPGGCTTNRLTVSATAARTRTHRLDCDGSIVSSMRWCSLRLPRRGVLWRGASLLGAEPLTHAHGVAGCVCVCMHADGVQRQPGDGVAGESAVQRLCAVGDDSRHRARDATPHVHAPRERRRWLTSHGEPHRLGRCRRVSGCRRLGRRRRLPGERVIHPPVRPLGHAPQRDEWEGGRPRSRW